MSRALNSAVPSKGFDHNFKYCFVYKYGNFVISVCKCFKGQLNLCLLQVPNLFKKYSPPHTRFNYQKVRQEQIEFARKIFRGF